MRVLMISKIELKSIVDDLCRKLLLIEGEKKDSKRKDIIDSILYNEGSEIKQLRKVLKNLDLPHK